MPYSFLRGIVIGFILAAPVGPVGILCIRRALADGRHAAFIASLGAAVADTLYGVIATFSLTMVSSFLFGHQTILRLVGGLFLVVLGVRAWRRGLAIETSPLAGHGLFRDFVSTFALTLTNPATILAFMGIFAAVGGLHQRDLASSWSLISGVFTGSSLWWLVLSALAGMARRHFAPIWLTRVNQVSAALLVISGLAIVSSLAWLAVEG